MVVNLAVPFFSQRENSYIWKQRYENDITDDKTNKVIHEKGSPVTDSSGKEKTVKIWDECCNITCLAMVLNYLGITQDTPYQMCKKIFADDYPKDPLKHADFDRYISYRKGKFPEDKGFRCIEFLEILKRIAKDIYNVRNVYTSSLTNTLDGIKKQVESGYPVIVSCGITRPSSEWLKNEMETNSNPTSSTKAAYNALKNDVNYEYHGHYIVIRGFTSTGDIIINDPWGKATDDGGEIPAETENGKKIDKWGYYNTNIKEGANKGENIIISKSDFERQYHGKLWSVLIIYDRRWSFPFRHCLTNFTKDSQDTYKRYIPDQKQVEACYKLQVSGVYYPITSTCTPHNGIHINNGKYTSFYSIGSGMLVVAKLCNKENEIIENGSNCFILVKHQVQMPKKTPAMPVGIKTFFCLYSHIRPLSFTDEDFEKIRFLNELNHEKNKDKEKKYFDESDVDGNTNVLQSEAKHLLDRLMAGETVIFNEGKIISEVCEGDYLGQTGSKGFNSESVRDCMHWEIFSNENFFADKTRYGEYNIMDFTGVNYYNREQVIKSCKEKLFNSFGTDKKYSKYTKHLNENAIAPVGIDVFYSTAYSQKSRRIVLHNKSEWDSDRDFPTEYSNSKQKGFTIIEKELSVFGDKYVKPFLWWNKEVDDAINKDLMLKITNKTPYYFEPINFLVWLMKNDDELYKQICPNAYDNEFA